MKFVPILVGITLLLFLVIKFGTFYRPNCTGDICGGPDKLQYIFAKGESLCKIVNGNYQMEVSGWGNKKIKTCNVKSKLICALRGGELKDNSIQSDSGAVLFGTSDNYYCGK